MADPSPKTSVDPRTWNRPDFRKNMRKVLMLAGIAASWTKPEKDDQFVALLSSLVEEDDKFNQICDILSIPS